MKKPLSNIVSFAIYLEISIKLVASGIVRTRKLMVPEGMGEMVRCQGYRMVDPSSNPHGNIIPATYLIRAVRGRACVRSLLKVYIYLQCFKTGSGPSKPST